MRRRERRHILRVSEAVSEAGSARRGAKERRGSARQRREREWERCARRRAVAYARWARLHGVRLSEAAGELELRERTLREWLDVWREGRLEIEPRGRKPVRSEWAERQALLWTLAILGPRTGVRTLWKMYPKMARREVASMVHRFRVAHARRHPLFAHRLKWRMPGAVLGMDFTQPPEPIADRYPAVLSIRDLARGRTLLWKPVLGESAAEAIRCLEMVLPLASGVVVLKTDCGAAFMSAEFGRFLRERAIRHLLSPVRRPNYNGAVEKGIGDLKRRTEELAQAAGRPGEWRQEDMEAARWIENALRIIRHGAADGPGDAGMELTPDLRADFHARVEEELLRVREELGIPPAAVLGRKEMIKVERRAIVRALVASNILLVRRRRISPPLKSISRAKIS